VEIVLNDEDRLVFGRCGCVFFQENLMGQGPCEHLLALLLVAQPQRKDSASSVRMDKEAFESGQAGDSKPERRREREDSKDTEDAEDDLDESEEER
jgi:hypothetical protein